MALFLIGLGLGDESDITVKGLEAVKKCSEVYLESYTGLLEASIGDLQRKYQVKILPAGREMVEDGKELLAAAENADVALLVPGDPLSATTHVELLMAAREQGIAVKVIHNASIFTSIAETGLQLYKFGKVTSIPLYEDNFKPEGFFDIYEQNISAGAHTLILLEIRVPTGKFVSVNSAIATMLSIAQARKSGLFDEKTLCVGCGRLGFRNQLIQAGPAGELLKADFGKAPQCLIIPGLLHFREEDALRILHGLRQDS